MIAYMLYNVRNPTFYLVSLSQR